MARKKRNRKGIKRYPTDFSQKRWEIIKDLLPDAAPGGRPRTINMRKLL
jgi:transposase